jgi:hypothetical protein
LLAEFYSGTIIAGYDFIVGYCKGGSHREGQAGGQNLKPGENFISKAIFCCTDIITIS